MAFITRTIATGLLLLACLAAPQPTAAAQAPQGGPPKQTNEYVPIGELPPQDQLPAAPLLIAAYSFVLVVFFLYVLSLARRLSSVQRDVDRLGTTLKQGSKP